MSGLRRSLKSMSSLFIQGAAVFTACIRMDVMLRLFPKFVTPQQEELAAMVEARGGDAALENEEVMEELIGAEFIRTARSGDQRDGGRPSSLVELQQEIKGNLDDAVKKNADFFDRKFEIQKREIMDDIDRALSRQGIGSSLP